MNQKDCRLPEVRAHDILAFAPQTLVELYHWRFYALEQNVGSALSFSWMRTVHDTGSEEKATFNDSHKYATPIHMS